MYAVPDPSLRRPAGRRARRCAGDLAPGEFEDFLAAQPDLGPKQWPRYVRILDALPRTATNKVLKRELRAEGLGDGHRGRARSAARRTPRAERSGLDEVRHPAEDPRDRPFARGDGAWQRCRRERRGVRNWWRVGRCDVAGARGRGGERPEEGPRRQPRREENGGLLPVVPESASTAS